MGQRSKDATLVERLQVLWAERNPSLYYSLRKYFFAAAVCVSPRLDSLGGGKRGKCLQVGRVEEEEYIKVKKNVTFATPLEIFSSIFFLFPVIHR